MLLYKFLGHDVERFKKWDRFVSEIKSNKQKESLLYSVNNIFKHDLTLSNLIVDRIKDFSKITKEHIVLAGRLLRKIYCLVLVQEEIWRTSTETSSSVDVKVLIEETKTPSLLILMG